LLVFFVLALPALVAPAGVVVGVRLVEKIEDVRAARLGSSHANVLFDAGAQISQLERLAQIAGGLDLRSLCRSLIRRREHDNGHVGARRRLLTFHESWETARSEKFFSTPSGMLIALHQASTK
jgi:hypothetical protein